MAIRISYEDRTKYADTPTFRTPVYGNLLSDRYQGEVYQDVDSNKWTGWFMNLSNPSGCYPTEFKAGFTKSLYAKRWVTNKLKKVLESGKGR